MARKRLISPEFFRHGDLFDAEIAARLPLRLAFAGLWTVADRRGYFAWTPRELKVQVLPHDSVDFAAVLDALEQHGFVESYVVSGRRYARIPSFTQWQTFHHAEKPSHVPEPEANTDRTPDEPRASLGLTPEIVGANPTVTVTVTAPSTVTACNTQEGARLFPARNSEKPPAPEVRTAVNACLPFVAESAHDALATLLEAVPNATAWAAILRSYAAGMHGNAAGPSRLGEAIQDFVAGNWHKDRPTAKWFRGFVRSSRGQAQSAEHMDFDRDRCEELRMIREQNEKRRAQRLELKTEPTWATELDARYPDGRTFPHPSAA